MGAQAQGYVARSAFKLLQIHQKHQVIHQGARPNVLVRTTHLAVSSPPSGSQLECWGFNFAGNCVLDLGCSPGGSCTLLHAQSLCCEGASDVFD